MVKLQELELFDYLSRQAKLRDWLNERLAEDTGVLMQALDIDQLRRAQGRAGAWQTMLKLLDSAPAALNKRA